MASETIRFEGSRGYQLSGRMDMPEGQPRAWAILAHCFTCGKDSLASARIAGALARAGIGVLRFDFAGLGASGGAFADGSFAADVNDLIAAGQHMTAAGRTPSLLIGHSLGGAAALAAAASMPSIKAVATIGAPADVAHILTQFAPESLAKIAAEGEAEVSLAGRPFVVRKGFVENARAEDLEARIAALHRPLLVMHSPTDDTVGIDHATRIFLAAKHPRSFVSLDHADHLLTKREDADYVADVIAAWASRYLPHAEPLAAANSEPVGIVAEETGKGGYQLAMRSGPHRYFADEPTALGGLGSGLSPYEFVASGLAACTAITVRMYAQRKGMPLQRIRVRVEHTKLPEQTPQDQFARSIVLEGPLDAEQRAKLLAIANKCPVDLTLTRGSSVPTKMLEDGESVDW
ncbi:bifunctional alpha/beta hydrolase/OsmC family protein [Dyella choica]|uniref:OsmC family protein n=1 Tax=Dyella choica TaxID=1927959 RepID=A0A3S0SB55_9GAMM|nr:bifunctional alpha/beta hydrolase/OsmC family protein [Dyella choica]RUL77613.1 OsmC family protein [Dyella choica]